MSDESHIIIRHQYIIEHLMYYAISDSRLVDEPFLGIMHYESFIFPMTIGSLFEIVDESEKMFFSMTVKSEHIRAF